MAAVTNTLIRSKTAEAILALRDLGLAIAASRPDRDAVMETLRAGRLRVVLDEQTAAITFGFAVGEGKPVQWIETVQCDPDDEQTFGRLASSVVGHATTTH